MRCLSIGPNNAAAATTGPGDFDFSRMTTMTREIECMADRRVRI